MAETYLIGIAGPSGAGKSYLAQRLACVLNAPVLSTDSYYRDLVHLPPGERALCNFDDPAAIEHELLIEDVRQLSNRAAVEVPCYEFATHSRLVATTPFGPADVVVIEGLFTLYWPELRVLLGTKVYLEIDDAVCLERRTMRDVRERGRSRESVEHQFKTTVVPMTELYIRPTRAAADIVLPGDAPIEEAVASVVDHMKRQLANHQVSSLHQ